MPVNFEAVRGLLARDPRKLEEGELQLLKKWLIEIPYFSAMALSDKQSFEDAALLLDRKTLNGEQLLSQEHSVEFLVVLTGKVEVIRTIHQGSGKKKRKQVEAIEENLGLLKEGDWRENVGQCRLTPPRNCSTEIAFLSLRSCDKVRKAAETRTTEIKMNILQQISLFEGLDKPFLKRLAEKGVYRTFYLNNYIYHINDPVQEGCFVLLEGSVKIVKQHVAKEPWNPPFRSLRMDMTILSPVQLFGEEELLVASSKRSYSVVCITSIVQLLEIPQEVFASVMRSHTKLNGDAEIKKFETERASLHNRLLAKSRQIMTGIEDVKFPPITDKSLPLLHLRQKPPRLEDTRNNSFFDKSLEQRQYRLIKNAHMILQTTPVRRNSGGVVRSTSNTSAHELPRIQSQLSRLS